MTSADVQVLAPVGSAPGISAPGKSDVAKVADPNPNPPPTPTPTPTPNPNQVAEPQTGRTSADLRLISAPGKVRA